MATLNMNQTFPNVVLAITNNRGEPASVEGIPVWGSSDDTVLRVTPAADGMSAVVAPVSIGNARISVSADANLDPNVTSTINGVSEDVEVVADPDSVASTITLSLGEAVTNPPVTP